MLLLQDYNKALKYAKALLIIEPGNHQAQELKEYIDKKMKKGEGRWVILGMIEEMSVVRSNFFDLCDYMSVNYPSPCHHVTSSATFVDTI